MVQVFLDIDIGDAVRYAEDLAAYQRGQAFLKECGSQYGLPGSLADLDEEGQTLLQESYASDPNWSSQGVSLQPIWQSCSRVLAPNTVTPAWLQVLYQSRSLLLCEQAAS